MAPPPISPIHPPRTRRFQTRPARECAAQPQERAADLVADADPPVLVVHDDGLDGVGVVRVVTVGVGAGAGGAAEHGLVNRWRWFVFG